jgi:hypothetical protein
VSSLTSSSPGLAPSPPAPGPAAVVAAAEKILARRLWCVVEVCLDVPRQHWEPRLVIFHRDGADVAAAVAEWTRSEPGRDVRLTGCRRTDLRLEPDAPTHLCHLAGTT